MAKKSDAVKTVPILPNGMSYAEKTPDLEFLTHSKNKWVPVIQGLKVLDSIRCIKIDIAGAGKTRIQTIRNSIRKTAKEMNFTPQIRFTVKDINLYVWANK